MLLDLISETVCQEDFFEGPRPETSSKLMSLVEKINNQMGRNTLFFAAEDIHKKWQIKSLNRSPFYTTRWDDLAKVIA